MLHSLRKRSSSILTFLLVAMLVGVMAVWYGGGRADKGSGGAGGAPAAWVNGELITRREYQQELEARIAQFRGIFGAQFDEKFLIQLQVPRRALDDLIQLKLLTQQAQRLHFVVSDKELADHIRGLSYFQKNGKFDSEAYGKIQNVGLLEKRQREQLLLTKFRTYLTDRVRLTPAWLERAYALKETKIDLDYAKFGPSELSQNKSATPSEIQAFIKKTPDTAFNDYYTAHKTDFTEKGEVQYRQIRVGIPFKSTPAQKEQAKKKIDDVAKDLTPQNFAEKAKKHSDDEFASKGGMAGWVKLGSLEPALDNALRTLPPGQVSPPIETSFGYFVILVSDKKEEKVRGLPEVKEKIAEKLATERVRKELSENLIKKWEALLEQGKPLESEFAKYKVSIKKTGPFSVGQGHVPNIGESDAILDTVLALSPSQPVSKKLLFQQGDYFYLKLGKVEKAKPADFEKKSEGVEKSTETSLQSELMNQWVEGLRKEANVETAIALPGSVPPSESGE